MHCNSCKLLLENSISNLDKVKSVDANVQKWTLIIWYEQTPNFDDINKIIRECWYEVTDEEIYRPWLSKNINDYKILLFSLIWFILLYFILSKTWISSLFAIKSQWSPSLSLVLLIWITAGFSSCMAVVGWLVLGISTKWNQETEKQPFWKRIIPHFRFNAGRVIWFGVLWWILGLLGSVISLSPFMMSLMTLVVGFVMLLLWINLTHISPKLSAISVSLPTWRLFNKKETSTISKKESWFMKYAWTFGSGVLTFFLPCGFTFAMQLYAVSTGSFWMWMAIMALFAIWTLPWLFGIGSLTSAFKGKTAKIAYQSIWVLVVLLWLYNISNSYVVVKMKFNSNGNSSITQNFDNSEIINMAYTKNWLTPSVLNLEVWKNYKIIVDVQVSIYSCLNTMYIPGLDNNYKELKKGEKVEFNFSATTPGEYPFLCATMWMSQGSKIIIK